MSINLNDILFAHYILFDYNVEDSVVLKTNFKNHPHGEAWHLFKIEDSIHFKAITSNDYKAYNRLIETTKQEEHSELKFKELQKNFNTSILHENKMHIAYNNDLKRYVVQDGCHRLAIIQLAALGITNTVPNDWFLIE